jgi:NHL repeat
VSNPTTWARRWPGRGALELVAALVWFAGCGEGAEPCGKPGQICLVAGTGELAFNGDHRRASETSFYLPTAVRPAPDGSVLVMDFNNMRLRRVREDGRVETVAGSGLHLLAVTGVSALESPFENPIDFALTPDGEILIVSLHDPRVLRVDTRGTLDALAGTGEPRYAGDGPSALEASFIELTGIALAPDGSVFVADGGASCVRVLRPDGSVATVAGGLARGYDGDGGPAEWALLDYPQGLAVDEDGNLFIADSRAHVVRKVDAAGTIETVAGTGEAGFDGDDGPAAAAALREPEGVFASESGELFISDTGNNRVRRVDSAGLITTIAGTGEAGYSGDGGPALSAQLNGPSRLWVSEGRVYIPDARNGVVRVVHMSGPP